MQTETPTEKPARRRRKWPWFVGGGVLLIVIAAIAGPFVYIHFIQADPPPAFTIENVSAGATTTASGAGATAADPPATTAAPGGSAASSDAIDGTWTITTGSQAGYRVKEVLFGQDTDAVGRTSDVTGSLTIAGTTVSGGSFKVDLTNVRSDESRRDSAFQGRIMETSQFPDATFTLTRPVDLGSVPADQAKVTFTATGDLMLHGVTKSVQVAIDARRNGANIEVVGSIPVKFADYQIDNPSSAGITTQDNGVVEFSLVLSKS
jgi:polyisoprenoid-binding protein YceI